MNNITQNFPEEENYGRIYITPEIEKGQPTYRVIAQIITKENDPGEPNYPVPLDSKVIDFLMTEKPTKKGVSDFLESEGFDLTFGKWLLISWHAPIWSSPVQMY